MTIQELSTAQLSDGVKQLLTPNALDPTTKALPKTYTFQILKTSYDTLEVSASDLCDEIIRRARLETTNAKG